MNKLEQIGSFSPPESGNQITAGLKCQLDIHSLSEYEERDARLSQELARRMAYSLESVGISDCLLQIDEGYIDKVGNYTNEEEPHYQLAALFGDKNANLLKKVQLSATYSGTANGENYDGLVQVAVSLPTDSAETCKALETEAFTQYNNLMLEVYPEWTTTYDPASIQFTELPSM